jgi:hypothetical protein
MIRASEPPMKLRLPTESGSIRGVIALSKRGRHMFLKSVHCHDILNLCLCN